MMMSWFAPIPEQVCRLFHMSKLNIDVLVFVCSFVDVFCSNRRKRYAKWTFKDFVNFDSGVGD